MRTSVFLFSASPKKQKHSCADFYFCSAGRTGFSPQGEKPISAPSDFLPLSSSHFVPAIWKNQTWKFVPAKIKNAQIKNLSVKTLTEFLKNAIAFFKKNFKFCLSSFVTYRGVVVTPDKWFLFSLHHFLPISVYQSAIKSAVCLYQLEILIAKIVDGV